MSGVRIPYRSATVLPPGIPPLNLFRLWAHSPSTLPHAISLGTACFRDTSLSPYQRELVCLLNASRLASDYQCKQHIPIAKAAGVTDRQIDALLYGDICSSVWSEAEKALLAFVDGVIAGSEVCDEVFGNARIWFGDQILVEVVTVQGYNQILAKLTTVFRIDPEHSSRSSSGAGVSGGGT